MSLPRWLSQRIKQFSGFIGREQDPAALLPIPEFKAADPDQPDDRYILGVSLGQPKAQSAMVGVRRRSTTSELNSQLQVRQYTLLGLTTWDKGTPYAVIAADISARASEPPWCNCLLPIDRTFVGAGIIDIMKAAYPPASVKPITATDERNAVVDGPGWKVPRLDLVAKVDEIMQSDRLSVTKDKEGKHKRLQKSMGSFQGGRFASHAVWALAVAIWTSEKYAGGGFWFRAD